MVSLLDINVLLAIVWPNHLHHAAARSWFLNSAASGWATCALSESGFVRLSSNPKVFPDAVSPRESIVMLNELKKRGAWSYLADETQFTELPESWSIRLSGYRQVSDIHLLSIVQSHGASLVTFDAKLKRLVPEAESKRLLQVIGLDRE